MWNLLNINDMTSRTLSEFVYLSVKQTSDMSKKNKADNIQH